MESVALYSPCSEKFMSFLSQIILKKEEGKKKSPYFGGLAGFKYQPLLPFHWCSAVFVRLFWKPLQHMNLQSADTYATELKVFFIREEPLRASLGFLHCIRPLPALPLHFISLW